MILDSRPTSCRQLVKSICAQPLTSQFIREYFIYMRNNKQFCMQTDFQQQAHFVCTSCKIDPRKMRASEIQRVWIFTKLAQMSRAVAARRCEKKIKICIAASWKLWMSSSLSKHYSMQRRAAEEAPFARYLMCFERLVLLFESVCQFSHLLKLRIKEYRE